MKKIMTMCVSLFAYTYATAQEVRTESLDERINDGFKNATDWFVDAIFAEIPITSQVGIPWVLIVLLFGASYFTIYFKGINFRNFWTSINIVRGKYDDLETSNTLEVSESVRTIEGDQPDTVRVEGKDGEVSHFQALTAALSATVGLGNVAGVAIALSIGGAGATFWMILVGLLGMASKFVECTLGVAYREIDENGTVYGGPMYYLSKGLKEKGLTTLGKVLAVIFAIMCVGGSFGGGNMFQANQAFKLFEHVTGAENSFIYGKGWLFGLIMAIFVGIVIIGGIKKIAKVTDKIVPSMVVVYILAVITVIAINYKVIPDAIYAIINGAFSAEGITGGMIGVMIQGFRRAAFSNEAGIGSASIAHSAVKTKYAASEGLVALLEPFIDTVVICTMTAIVLIITGQIQVGTEISDEQGVLLTASALESGISWFPYILSLAVILFAFSSMISWSYYGYQAWSYLFGRKKYVEYIYKSIFCICVIIGSAASLTAVTDFSDAMIFSMLVPNMIGLFLMAPRVAKELKKYKQAISMNKIL
ncbi:alanine:cation symporter family protein [Aquimarina sp. BL5]|uniref:alanine/glycine:cation symporter family protein n=1 Tax=Aquimarina sp. BL5 TaxID=1714860 RepID=UPI000E522EE4|nr:alanine/glycine:cation symporter family protein [Aquimarina sp. BL5]AXT53230.1 alanine:cation symporter family protein [Aquimarina sp. BL5]RKN02929.1 amino acid carrier protein [Aquimarina sp. BL5]